MNGAPRWCGGSGFVSYLVQLFCRWRWDTYLLRCGELVGLLPCVTEGFESVCALLPELNLEVVADEDVVEPVGAVLGEPDLFVEVLEGGVAVAKVLAAFVTVSLSGCLYFSTERQINYGLNHYEMGLYDLAIPPLMTM